MDENKKKEAYCVRCKKKIIAVNTEEIRMQSGRPAMKGKCPHCNTGTYRILPINIRVDI